MKSSMSQSIARMDIPATIRQYLDRHRVRDAEGAIATFAPDATVLDEGHTYQGIAEIRSWLVNGASEYTYITTETGYERRDSDRFTVLTHLEGNFPGGVADLAFDFTLTGGLIGALEIA